MNKVIALALAAVLIALGIYYFKRHTHRPVAAIETQVDTTQDLAPEAGAEQEAA